MRLDIAKMLIVRNLKLNPLINNSNLIKKIKVSRSYFYANSLHDYVKLEKTKIIESH